MDTPAAAVIAIPGEKADVVSAPYADSMDREPKNEGIDLPVPGAVVIKPNAAIPGNMHEFERDSRVHVFLITISVIIVAFLINYGFEMLSLYGDLQKTVPNIGAVSQANRDTLLAEYNQLVGNGTENLCDIPFFVEQKNSDFIKEPLGLVLTLMKTSLGLSVGLFIWMFLFFKIASAVTRIRTRFRDNEGRWEMKHMEKRVRRLLYAETISFLIIQFCMEIPQATVAFFYLLFVNGKRGQRCIEKYNEGVVAEYGSFTDDIGDIPLVMLGFTLVSIVWNFSTLMVRWLRHTTHYAKRDDHTLREQMLKGVVFFILYISAAITPMLLVLWNDFGWDTFGLETAGNPVLLGVSIFGAFGFGLGLLSLCFISNGDMICIPCILSESCGLGLEVCDCPLYDVCCEQFCCC